MKLAKHALIKRITSKCVCDFACDWQRVNMFSHCVTLACILLPQILSYSDTKVLVLLVVTECNPASGIYVYELIFLLQGQQSVNYNTTQIDHRLRGLSR